MGSGMLKPHIATFCLTAWRLEPYVGPFGKLPNWVYACETHCGEENIAQTCTLDVSIENMKKVDYPTGVNKKCSSVGKSRFCMLQLCIHIDKSIRIVNIQWHAVLKHTPRQNGWPLPNQSGKCWLSVLASLVKYMKYWIMQFFNEIIEFYSCD